LLAAGFDGFLGKPYSREQIFDYIAQHLGVRYVYRAGSEKTDGHLPLRPEDLATIPARLREELENAVISLNPQRIMAAVRQVSEHDATVGNVLKRFAGEYTYTPILDALQRCEKRSTQASP